MKSEFDLIGFIKNKAARKYNKDSRVRIGIGDDCAVLPKDSKSDLVMTTDLLVEDVDFRLKWTKPEFLGHKALAVSLSDIAAMGAKPVWAMLSIGIPKTIWKTDFVEEFYEGWFDLANKFGVELVGGDVSKTPDKIVIDSIAAGETKKGKAVLRSGARAGDLVYVTGELGEAAAGLKLLESGENHENSTHKSLLLRQLAPNPQIEIGKILGEKNLVTSMIDLSDGLSSDLFHVCAASKTGAQIFADKIPSFFSGENLREIFNPAEINNFIFNGGEDFELLFTINPKKKFQLEKALENHKISRIGEITANVEMIELVSTEKSEILQPKGFRHF
jgi:thiamine-monophosphate kinase